MRGAGCRPCAALPHSTRRPSEIDTMRMLTTCVCVLVICAGNASAQLKPSREATDEVNGIVKSADLEKGTITVKEGEKERTLPVAKNARFQPCLNPAKNVGDLKVGTFVVLFTAEREGKLIVIELAEDKK